MPFKPMKLRDYQKLIRQYEWLLVKGSFDWKLVDSNGHVLIPNIIVTHPGKEVVPESVKKTLRLIDSL